MIDGLDVGLDQGVISLSDWHTIRNEGKRFVLIRCVEGMGTIDPRFSANVAGAGTAGFVMGAYFPLHPDLDPVKQARDHFAACKGLGTKQGELAPWCDIELTRGKTPSEVLAATIAWCNEASQLWGRRVTIYTYPYFDHSELTTGAEDGASLADTNLAMAAYQKDAPTVAPKPWSSIAWWQDTGGANVSGLKVYHVPNGCPCDSDKFLGDEAAFEDAQDPTKG